MAEYLDINRLNSNDYAYLIEQLELMCQDYCNYRAGTFPEFMSDRYGVEFVEDTLSMLEEMQKRMTVSVRSNFH